MLFIHFKQKILFKFHQSSIPSFLYHSYAFNLGALHSDRSKFGSIAHNSKVDHSSDGPETESCFSYDLALRFKI